MCRFVNTEQLIGIIFLKLIEKDEYELEISKLNEIGMQIDGVIRKENNAILCFSKKEFQSFTENYGELFDFREKKIKLLKSDMEEKKIIELLQDYFYDGTPRDIIKTIENILDEKLKNVCA